MAVTVQAIYDDVCYALLENGGLSLYLTQQELLDLFRAVYLDFVERCGLTWQIFTQMSSAGTAEYTVPDDIIKPLEAFLGGKYLQETSLQELDMYEFAWKKRLGTPDRWRQDSLPVKQFSVFPKPAQTGKAYTAPTPPQTIPGLYGTFAPADRNLSIVGIQGTLKTSFALGDTIPALPDSFTYYLGYGVMAQFFGQDGEAKDVQRQAYCEARYTEGIAIARSFMGEVVGVF